MEKISLKEKLQLKKALKTPKIETETTTGNFNFPDFLLLALGLFIGFIMLKNKTEKTL